MVKTKRTILIIALSFIAVISLAMGGTFAYFGIQAAPSSATVSVDIRNNNYAEISDFATLFAASKAEYWNDKDTVSESGAVTYYSATDSTESDKTVDTSRKVLKLTQNVTLENDIIITADVHIDLNGHTLNLAGHTLTVSHSYTGTFLLYDGTATAGASNTGMITSYTLTNRAITTEAAYSATARSTANSTTTSAASATVNTSSSTESGTTTTVTATYGSGTSTETRIYAITTTDGGNTYSATVNTGITETEVTAKTSGGTTTYTITYTNNDTAYEDTVEVYKTTLYAESNAAITETSSTESGTTTDTIEIEAKYESGNVVYTLTTTDGGSSYSAQISGITVDDGKTPTATALASGNVTTYTVNYTYENTDYVATVTSTKTYCAANIVINTPNAAVINNATIDTTAITITEVANTDSVQQEAYLAYSAFYYVGTALASSIEVRPEQLTYSEFNAGVTADTVYTATESTNESGTTSTSYLFNDTLFLAKKTHEATSSTEEATEEATEACAYIATGKDLILPAQYLSGDYTFSYTVGDNTKLSAMGNSLAKGDTTLTVTLYKDGAATAYSVSFTVHVVNSGSTDAGKALIKSYLNNVLTKDGDTYAIDAGLQLPACDEDLGLTYSYAWYGEATGSTTVGDKISDNKASVKETTDYVYTVISSENCKYLRVTINSGKDSETTLDIHVYSTYVTDDEAIAQIILNMAHGGAILFDANDTTTTGNGISLLNFTDLNTTYSSYKDGYDITNISWALSDEAKKYYDLDTNTDGSDNTTYTIKINGSPSDGRLGDALTCTFTFGSGSEEVKEVIYLDIIYTSATGNSVNGFIKYYNLYDADVSTSVSKNFTLPFSFETSAPYTVYEFAQRYDVTDNKTGYKENSHNDNGTVITYYTKGEDGTATLAYSLPSAITVYLAKEDKDGDLSVTTGTEGNYTTVKYTKYTDAKFSYSDSVTSLQAAFDYWLTTGSGSSYTLSSLASDGAVWVVSIDYTEVTDTDVEDILILYNYTFSNSTTGSAPTWTAYKQNYTTYSATLSGGSTELSSTEVTVETNSTAEAVTITITAAYSNGQKDVYTLVSDGSGYSCSGVKVTPSGGTETAATAVSASVAVTTNTTYTVAYTYDGTTYTATITYDGTTYTATITSGTSEAYCTESTVTPFTLKGGVFYDADSTKENAITDKALFVWMSDTFKGTNFSKSTGTATVEASGNTTTYTITYANGTTEVCAISTSDYSVTTDITDSSGNTSKKTGTAEKTEDTTAGTVTYTITYTDSTETCVISTSGTDYSVTNTVTPINSGIFITTDELEEAATLDATESGSILTEVKNWNGIRYITGLTEVNLSGVTGLTYTVLNNFTAAEVLTLQNCGLKTADLEDTSGNIELTNLRELDVRDNNILTFGWLNTTSFPSLEKAHITGNTPTDSNKYEGNTGISNYYIFEELTRDGVTVYNTTNSNNVEIPFAESTTLNDYVRLKSLVYQSIINTGEDIRLCYAEFAGYTVTETDKTNHTYTVDTSTSTEHALTLSDFGLSTSTYKEITSGCWSYEGYDSTNTSTTSTAETTASYFSLTLTTEINNYEVTVRYYVDRRASSSNSSSSGDA